MVGHRINFGIQTLWIFGALITLASGLVTRMNDGPYIILLLFQLAIGITQLISGLVNIITVRKLIKRIRTMYIVYWGVVVFYFIAGGFLYFFYVENFDYNYSYDDSYWERRETVRYAILAFPWTIAIFHYVLVTMQAFGKKKQPPHLGDPFYQGHWPLE